MVYVFTTMNCASGGDKSMFRIPLIDALLTIKQTLIEGFKRAPDVQNSAQKI